jgi:EmrB/QacA subfamily drug resistance transporter
MSNQAQPSPETVLVRQHPLLERIFAHVERKWLVLIAVATGSLMGAIDISIANVALPVIHHDLGSTVAMVEWVVSIYLLVVCALLLSFGRLGDLRSHKQVYIAGFVVFTISSALCGLAWNVETLIIARALQAMGAAAVFANSQAILTGNFPPTQRGRAMGLQAVMIFLGQMIGPALGGWLIDHFSWRAVFYINIPVGVLAVTFSMIFIPRERAGKSEPFDYFGAIIFAAAFTLLLIGLNQGYERGWTSPSILLLLVGAVALLAFFVGWETRREHPLLDLELFRVRLFSLTVVSAIFNYMAVYTITFLIPFYLIQGRSLTPSRTGLLMMIQPAIMLITAPISGIVSDRIGTRRPSMLGMAMMGCGLLVLAQLHADTSLRLVIVGLFLTGLGNGMFMVPNNSAMMGAAPRHRQGIASGVLATARYIGMILGVGVSGAIFTTMLARHTATALFDGVRVGFYIAAAASFFAVVTCSTRALPPHHGDGWSALGE